VALDSGVVTIWKLSEGASEGVSGAWITWRRLSEHPRSRVTCDSADRPSSGELGLQFGYSALEPLDNFLHRLLLVFRKLCCGVV
jgi:hypothetical protein